MRFFAQISYDGTAYAGWQQQPNAPTVQAQVERALNVLHSAEEIPVVGCGRTDAGVHAKDYMLHFDIAESRFDNERLAYKWDKILPTDISIHRVYTVEDDRHARFDAMSRSYRYHLHVIKDPFKGRYSTFYAAAKDVDLTILNEVAEMIMSHQDQATFCKTHTDVKTTLCNITESHWTQSEDGSLIYHISANRFLRGMVRLIVGTSINVALGKLSIATLDQHMRDKSKPDYHYSAPPQGLFLQHIKYPYQLR